MATEPSKTVFLPPNKLPHPDRGRARAHEVFKRYLNKDGVHEAIERYLINGGIRGDAVLDHSAAVQIIIDQCDEHRELRDMGLNDYELVKQLRVALHYFYQFDKHGRIVGYSVRIQRQLELK